MDSQTCLTRRLGDLPKGEEHYITDGHCRFLLSHRDVSIHSPHHPNVWHCSVAVRSSYWKRNWSKASKKRLGDHIRGTHPFAVGHGNAPTPEEAIEQAIADVKAEKRRHPARRYNGHSNQDLRDLLSYIEEQKKML